MELNKNYIAGEWVGSDHQVENINPSDLSDCIGHFAQADTRQLNTAVDAAAGALEAWRQVGLEARQSALNAIGEEMMRRAGELGELLSREEGKTLAEGKGEVFRAGQFFTYYAAEVLRQIGENSLSVRPNIDIDVHREPVGVVAVISPWNFPTATASWKIAPALAFGNAVIWKPANLTPASAVALTDIISRANLPAGVFQLLMGSGADIGDALVAHPGVDAVSFTGSYTVGQRVATLAAPNFTKIQLELGSKNALSVMEDADIDAAVTAALVGAYSGTGQKCTASSRLLVHEKIHDEFVAKLQIAISGLTVGHALAPDSKMGPVASEAQLQSNLNWLNQIKADNLTLVCGDEDIKTDTRGYYMAPALFVGGHNDMPCNREEMFAPIAVVQKISSYEQALSISNDTEYGLVAGIFTRSLARATHFRKHSKSGCVMINLPTAGTDYHVPFGGRKNSSYGSREQGRAAVEFYTHVKTTYSCAGQPE